MTNKPIKNAPIKPNKVYENPIATAKATGGHWSNSASHVEITPTPDSTPSANDGKLGGRNTHDGRQGWAPINKAAAPNTYRGDKGDSKRD